MQLGCAKVAAEGPAELGSSSAVDVRSIVGTTAEGAQGMLDVSLAEGSCNTLLRTPDLGNRGPGCRPAAWK